MQCRSDGEHKQQDRQGNSKEIDIIAAILG